MRQIQLVDLYTRALQQAALETDLGFVGVGATAIVKAMVSAQYGDLYGVVGQTGLRYFEKTTTTTMPGGSNVVVEPTDILSLVDTVERVRDTNGRLSRLRPIAPQERSAYAGRTGNARVWELVDRQLLLYPTPPAGDQYVLRYIPQPTDYTTAADATQIDVVSPDGESFMIWGVAVRCLGRIRSDVQLALTEREAARERLAEWASLRLFNEPPRQIPVDDDDCYPPRDGSWWYDR